MPVYDPSYVYGPWWYPSYPPYYWYYPPGFYSAAYIGFSPGIFFSFNAFSWVWFDWPVRRVHFDINRTRNFHNVRNIRRDDIGNVWRHNPQHRRGVAYRDLRTTERFGARAPRVSSPSTLDRRGFPGGRTEQQFVRPSQPTPQRGVGQAVPQTPRIQQAPVTRTPDSSIRRDGAAVPRIQPGPGSSQRPVVRDTPFRGIGQGNFERKAGERGGISNRGIQMRQQSGGSPGGQIQQRQGGGSFPGGGGSRGGGQGGGSRGGGSRR